MENKVEGEGIFHTSGEIEYCGKYKQICGYLQDDNIVNGWLDVNLDENWRVIMTVRSVITGALEIKRAEKMIGSSLETAPKVYLSGELVAKLTENVRHRQNLSKNFPVEGTYASILKDVNLADICITSGIDLTEGATPDDAFTLADVPGVAVIVEKAKGTKCERCWKYTTDIGSVKQHPTVCARCAGIVQKEVKSKAA